MGLVRVLAVGKPADWTMNDTNYELVMLPQILVNLLAHRVASEQNCTYVHDSMRAACDGQTMFNLFDVFPKERKYLNMTKISTQLMHSYNALPLLLLHQVRAVYRTSWCTYASTVCRRPPLTVQTHNAVLGQACGQRAQDLAHALIEPWRATRNEARRGAGDAVVVGVAAASKQPSEVLHAHAAREPRPLGGRRPRGHAAHLPHTA